MKISENRLRKIIRNILLKEEMFGLYKRDKKDKGFKWGKWSRDVGPGQGSGGYYDDYYDWGMDEVDEGEQLSAIEEDDIAETDGGKTDDPPGTLDGEAERS